MAITSVTEKPLQRFAFQYDGTSQSIVDLNAAIAGNGITATRVDAQHWTITNFFGVNPYDLASYVIFETSYTGEIRMIETYPSQAAFDQRWVLNP